VPAQHALNPALQAWADDIKKQSNGTITSTLFPSEQLGKAFDHYDMARDGIADFSYVNPGYQPGRFPIFAGLVAALPGSPTPRPAPPPSTPGTASTRPRK
jgi:TRAP-type C4-dicarboxylate transport system substrate-binding protein